MSIFIDRTLDMEYFSVSILCSLLVLSFFSFFFPRYSQGGSRGRVVHSHGRFPSGPSRRRLANLGTGWIEGRLHHPEAGMKQRLLSNTICSLAWMRGSFVTAVAAAAAAAA